MSIKSVAAKFLAKRAARQINDWTNNPITAQNRIYEYLHRQLLKTDYGKTLDAPNTLPRESWKDVVPLVDYEKLRNYVERIKQGEKDVLYPGKPSYLCTTSGTTSGAKYIPMTKEGIEAQVRAARNALLSYTHHSGNSAFVDGKMMFLQGSPELEYHNGIAHGRLSGIVAHHVPSYLQKNRMPSWSTNVMSDWEAKVDAIVKETSSEDMRLISGIPPWVMMYFERLLDHTGQSEVNRVFPNFSLFIYGGVNYEPYRARFQQLIGKHIDSLETYPASEGFIAFQEKSGTEGMLLNLDAGIYYEFIPLSEIHNANPTRLSLADVEAGVNYAIVLNTTSGLWGYLIGDTVKFVSIKPYRIIVTGRIAHFISAFGEHVIAEEVEQTMAFIVEKYGLQIHEFHVAPQVNPSSGLPYHEWFIETSDPLSTEAISDLDLELRKRNKYYDDLIEGKVLRPLVVQAIPINSFSKYMDSIGKLGGQNKLPRLANNRDIAAKLEAYL